MPKLRAAVYASTVALVLLVATLVFNRREPKKNDVPTLTIEPIPAPAPKSQKSSTQPAPAPLSSNVSTTPSPLQGNIKQDGTNPQKTSGQGALNTTTPQTIMAPKEFNRLTQRALQTLPQTSDVRSAAPDDVHHLSPTIISKIQILASLVDAVKNNPELEPDAMEFYQSCALKEDLMVTVRARCLAHLKELSDKHGRVVDLDKYPEEVKRLSEYIP